MENLFIITVLALLVVVLGIYALALRGKNSKLQQEKAELAQTNAELASEVQELRESNIRLEEQTKAQTANEDNVNKLYDKWLKEQQKSQEATEKKFELLATKVFASQANKSNAEMQKTLKPLQENLDNFRNRLENLATKRSADTKELKGHIESLLAANKRLSDEAEGLTRALKSDKKLQGNWGEVVLERILEQSGLEKGREYRVQPGIKTAEGLRRPDVIVDLPEAKHIIIDSKVSLNDYVEYSKSEDETEQQQHLSNYISRIDKHINDLSAKDYEKLPEINSLEYILMFFPLEAACITALQADPDLFERGMKKKIILVTPSNLLVTLKLIHNIWRNERRAQNAQEIARLGGGLYDKFEGFLNNLDGVGSALGKAQESYSKARAQLASGSGNLLSRSSSMQRHLIRNGQTAPEQAQQTTAAETSIVENLETMKSLGAAAKKQIKY